MVMRWRNAAFLTKPEVSEGVFLSPSAVTDGVLVEAPEVDLSPQNVETDEVTGSLDGRGPIIGGLQCRMSFRAYLKGSGTPGLAPEIADILKACGLAETVMSTDITATTISVTGTNTIADSGAGLAACTIGTPIYLIDPVNVGNNTELMVTASAAGSLTVTNLDGSAPGLTNFAAGPSISIRRGLAAVIAAAGAAAQLTAVAPWAATAGHYNNLPAWLSTNPAVPALAGIYDYSAARIAKLADTFSPILGATTKVGIPANVLYKPQSGVIPSNSCELYVDGVVWRFAGMRGDLSLTMNAAGASWLDVNMTGMFQAHVDAAVPTPTYDATRPGTWRDSRMSLNSVQGALRSLTMQLGNRMAYPSDPNSQEGFTSPQILGRRISGTIDPYKTLAGQRDLFGSFRAGTQMPLHARVLGGAGRVAGNRIALTIPNARYEAYKPTNDQGMATEQLGFFADGQDAGFGLAFF
jgi:hypothetical protein